MRPKNLETGFRMISCSIALVLISMFMFTGCGAVKTVAGTPGIDTAITYGLVEKYGDKENGCERIADANMFLYKTQTLWNSIADNELTGKETLGILKITDNDEDVKRALRKQLLFEFIKPVVQASIKEKRLLNEPEKALVTGAINRSVNITDRVLDILKCPQVAASVNQITIRTGSLIQLTGDT